jgi:hypothetical protein
MMAEEVEIDSGCVFLSTISLTLLNSDSSFYVIPCGTDASSPEDMALRYSDRVAFK